jgi:hypothetical protein
MSEILRPQQFQVQSVTIDGNDVKGIYQAIEIFENIYMSAIAGTVSILDTDGGGFIEKYGIEFNEPFSFTAKGSGEDNNIKFNGVLNGLRSENTKDSKRLYIIDFTTKELRNNEQEFINKKFDNETPQDIIKYCLQDKCKAQNLNLSGITGKPMQFIGSRRKPFWIIKHVLTHGVMQSEAGDGQNQQKKGKQLKGDTGFLCWQVLSDTGENEYRGTSLKTLRDGGSFKNHSGYGNKFANTSRSMEDMRKNIIDFNFQTMGDIQSKMKSGSLHSKIVSFDMDTGQYKEFEHRAEDQMTDKQKGIITKPTRVMNLPYVNEGFQNGCARGQANRNDQSRDYATQNNASQNAFNDQSGTITIYNTYGIHAGDTIEVQMNKVKSGESDGMKHRKHSGKYVVKQVCHVLNSGGEEGYTQLTLLRSTNSEEQ